jgi:hypothetical protein
VKNRAIVNRWRRCPCAESPVGRWHDRRTLRESTDRDFDVVLRSLAKALESEFLLEPGAAEVDDGGIGETAQFVDEIADCDDVGIGGCLVMTLTHDPLLLHSHNGNGTTSVPIRSAD